MKKSSFLHKPKDMLSKSFKPAKCKMSLKLAASRLKLLKNKKEVQVKQMKKELAQLLDSGQDQTARIRVEHVIREEKMMAAYDLIEIYCELIVARLPIIETQKNCPIDLKEAITSVIFASPRCGDIPELLDVRKHLTAKYGKEFTTAAIELRPDCGVSRMLVEKLSAKAPDGQVKIKALTAIAEGHNIKWDPKAFGESETLPNDLLNGPSTFENANKMQAEPPHFVPDVHASPSHHNQPLSYSEQNVRSSHATQNLPTQFSGVGKVVSSNLQPEKKHSGARADRAEIKQEFHGEAGAFSSGQQSWNMEFKDATSAAQAAAESAERASMAARAAAELSSRGRISRQHSSESHKSDVHVRRDEGTRKHSTSKLASDYPKDSTNVSFAERQTRVPDEKNTESERPYQDDYGSDIRSAQTFSSRSKGSFDKDLFIRNVGGADEYSQNSLSKEEEMEIHSNKSEAEYENHQHEGFSSEKFDYYGEERIEKQPSIVSSGSHSSVPGGDDKILNSGNRMFVHDFGEDHSAGIDEHMHKDYFHSGSHDTGGVIFDESGSDGEDFGFDTGSHHEELNASSPNRNLAGHLSADPGTGSLFESSKSKERSQSEFPPKRNSFHEFPGTVEATIDSSQPDNFGPVTFDESDGQSSEDETDMGHSWLRGTKDSTSLHGKENLSLGSTRSSLAGKHWKNEQRTEASVGPPQSFGSGEAPTSQSSPIREKSQLEPNDSDSDSYSEVNRHNSSQSKFSLVNEVNDINSSHSHGSEMNDENSGYDRGLNFDKLTGGFRHKGYTRPPYIRSQLDNISSLSRKGDEESPTVISGASPAAEGSSTGNSQVFGNARRSRLPDPSDDSDSDSSEAFEKQSSTHGREPYIGSTNKDVKEKSNSRGPVTYFHFESSDSEDDDSAKQVFTGRSRLGTGVSRRTKASASHLKGHSSSVVLEASDSVAERSSTTRFYSAETPQSSQSQKKHSGPGQDLQHSSSSGKLGSKTTMESKISSHDKNRESYGVEQPPNSKPTPESSGSAETWKISSRNSINKDGGKKASHVPSKQASGSAETQKISSQKSINKVDSVKKASDVHSKQKPEASDSNKPRKTASGNSITREDSGKRASHVHPKLPEYDTLAARIQALRTNHQ